MSETPEPAPEIIMDALGVYWRKYPEHFSMVPTSDDNEAVPKPWVLYRIVQNANPHREHLIEDNRELRADCDRLAAELDAVGIAAWKLAADLAEAVKLVEFFDRSSAFDRGLLRALSRQRRAFLDSAGTP